jgi:hypothetical protein
MGEVAAWIESVSGSRSIAELADKALRSTSTTLGTRAALLVLACPLERGSIVYSSAGPVPDPVGLLGQLRPGTPAGHSGVVPAGALGLPPDEAPVVSVVILPVPRPGLPPSRLLLTERTDGSPLDRADLDAARVLASATGALLGRFCPCNGAPDDGHGMRSERERIGRELHDGLVQSLYATGLSLEAALRRPGTPKEARGPLRESRETIDRLVEEVRSYVDTLGRPPLVVPQIGAAVDQLAAEAAAAGMDVSTEVAMAEETHLPAAARRELMSIAREAVSNSVRHGRARHLVIQLAIEGGTVWLTIRDDGVGFDPELPAGGHGLLNMTARALAIGGTLDVRSSDAGGTVVRFSGPLLRLVHLGEETSRP